jgi:hypothetical protein
MLELWSPFSCENAVPLSFLLVASAPTATSASAASPSTFVAAPFDFDELGWVGQCFGLERRSEGCSFPEHFLPLGQKHFWG